MGQLLERYDEKIKEIEMYFNYIWVMDNTKYISKRTPFENKRITTDIDTGTTIELDSIYRNNNYEITSEMIRMIKSTFYLVMYNLVEGIVVESLNEIFSAINNGNKSYAEYIDKYQYILAKYKYQNDFKKFENNCIEIIENIYTEVIQIKEFRDKSGKTYFNYDAYIKKIGKNSELGGNIDSLKLRNIATMYGVNLTVQECPQLLTIKDKRNQLAHGEITFSESGQQHSVEDLFVFKEKIIKYMKSYIEDVEEFIENKRFLKGSAG